MAPVRQPPMIEETNAGQGPRGRVYTAAAQPLSGSRIPEGHGPRVREHDGAAQNNRTGARAAAHSVALSREARIPRSSRLGDGPRRPPGALAKLIGIAAESSQRARPPGSPSPGAQTPGGGGGVGTPDPPKLTDVICLVAARTFESQRSAPRSSCGAAISTVWTRSALLRTPAARSRPNAHRRHLADGRGEGAERSGKRPVSVDAYGTQAQTPDGHDLKIVAARTDPVQRRLRAQLRRGRSPVELL